MSDTKQQNEGNSRFNGMFNLSPKGMFNMMNKAIEKGPCDKFEGTAKSLCLQAYEAGLSYDKENKAINFGDTGLFLGKEGAGFRFPF